MSSAKKCERRPKSDNNTSPRRNDTLTEDNDVNNSTVNSSPAKKKSSQQSKKKNPQITDDSVKKSKEVIIVKFSNVKRKQSLSPLSTDVSFMGADDKGSHKKQIRCKRRKADVRASTGSGSKRDKNNFSDGEHCQVKDLDLDNSSCFANPADSFEASTPHSRTSLRTKRARKWMDDFVFEKAEQKKSVQTRFASGKELDRSTLEKSEHVTDKINVCLSEESTFLSPDVITPKSGRRKKRLLPSSSKKNSQSSPRDKSESPSVNESNLSVETDDSVLVDGQRPKLPVKSSRKKKKVPTATLR